VGSFRGRGLIIVLSRNRRRSARHEDEDDCSELGHGREEKESNDFWACTTWELVIGDDERIYMLDRFKARMEYTKGRQDKGPEEPLAPQRHLDRGFE
jgi:hypothetical protein